MGLFNRRSQVDGEESAIGDSPAGGNGQPLCTGSRGQGAGIAVVDQSRAQLGELGGRVLARQQVQGGLVDTAGQRRERCATAYGIEPSVRVQRFQRGSRHGLLRQDVERVGGHPHGLDLAGEHALHSDRAADQVGAVLGEQHTARDLTDLVSGPTDALQTTGHRWRCLHLDHQVDRAHVDAQFQARGRHHRLEQSAFEVVLHQGALLLADRTVVGARQHWVGTEGLAATHDVRRRSTRHARVRVRGELDAEPFGVNLIEPRGKSFRQSPRIGEHDGRVVRFDQVDQTCLDIGPDGVVRQVGHIGHRHLHGQLKRLGRRGSHYGCPGCQGSARQEPRQLLGRTHRCR